MMSRSISLLLLLLSFCEISFTQGNLYHKSNYTTENGLPANGIKGMQWDEQTGFLWIATEAGVSRFNGIDFKNFTIANTPFISSERMAFMVKNNAGRIFTADQFGNICSVSMNQLVYYGKRRKALPGYYDNIFMLNISEPLFNDSISYRSTVPIALVFDLVLPRNDESCYVLHSSNIYHYTKGMRSIMHIKDTSGIKGGFLANGQVYVLSTKLQLFHINDTDQTLVPWKLQNPDGTPFREFTKESRIFWNNGMPHPVVISGNRSWLIKGDGNKLIASPLCNEIPTDAFIFCVQYSQEKDILFLGTDSKGIVVLTRNKLDPMKTRTPGTNERNAYYSQVTLPNGNVLTNQGHIIGPDPRDPSQVPIKGKFSFKTSSTGDSLIWYTQNNPQITSSCLYKYNRKTGTTIAYPKIIGSEIYVSQLASGKYAVSSEFGIAMLEGDSLRYIYRFPEVNYNNESYGFTEIRPNVILMASCTGILQFNLSTARTDTLLRSVGYCVRTLWRYRDYIFFGTYGKGIFVWKNGVLKPIPVDKNKYLLYAHCFQPDGSGYCWISTNRGLFKANIDEMVNAYETNASTVYYHYYGKNDGMEITEMNGGCSPCAVQLADKTISFPTMDGLLWVNPQKAMPILPKGDLFIEDILADNKPLPLEDDLDYRLPSKTRDISVDLAYPAWCGKENIYIDYQVNDTLNWKPVSTSNDVVIRLNNLAAGNYVLRIRKLNGFGIGNYSYKIIRFQIPIPWYQQWWFKLLVLGLFIALVLLYVSYRTRLLKKNQQRLEKVVAEKTNELLRKNEVLEKNNSITNRLISIISHDIVTPLKFLNAAGKNLMEKRKQMPEELQQETLSEITHTSQELQLLSTNILNWIKYQNENKRLMKEQFNLHELVQQVFSALNSMAKQKNVQLLNEVDTEVLITEFFEPLRIVIYNLVSNAINFTDQGSISVKSIKEEYGTVIIVKDQGTGMTPEQILNITDDEYIISAVKTDKRKGNGLGYLIIKDLLKMMKGSFSIQSEKGKGTEVRIELTGSPRS